MSNYTPELGQALYGNRWGDYEGSELLEAALRHLDEEIRRVEGNKGNRLTYESPFDNTGARWSNDTFSVRAYCWDEDSPEADEPNFQFGDLEVRWYKYLGRGMTTNRRVSAREISEMLDACLASVRAMEPRYD